MKFKIRDGFLAILKSVVDVGSGRKEMQTTHHFSNQEVDYTAAQAKAHAHKLEPLDKDAAAFLKGLATPSPESTISTVGIQAEIKLAVDAAIAAHIQAAAVTAAQAVQ